MLHFKGYLGVLWDAQSHENNFKQGRQQVSSVNQKWRQKPEVAISQTLDHVSEPITWEPMQTWPGLDMFVHINRASTISDYVINEMLQYID